MASAKREGPDTGRKRWWRLFGIAAWGGFIIYGALLTGLRLAHRISARQRAEGEIEALRKAGTAWRRRAETAEAEVRTSKGRISELQQDNARLRADLARQVEADQRFTGIHKEVEQIQARMDNVAAERAGAILDQHLAHLQAAQPGALIKAKVLNGKERSMFRSILNWTLGRKLRLLAQVSMGEYLDTTTGAKDLRWAYNDRRTDFLICDQDWVPMLAVEYHGSGHCLGRNWERRDAIKARALLLANVGLVIIEKDDGRREVGAKLDAAYARIEASRAGPLEARPVPGH
ncbi:DUF2726 domain-containing protein [Caulobacter sp. BP25]|uniref:DUF2726 domain-containing protein n=1 Tax=Caulobacter sp. BP25 TaxID=2048900 RepID=UPI0013747306|nr:DUF2726 domain-containing protein [Caulobacter sp. BP25]